MVKGFPIWGVKGGLQGLFQFKGQLGGLGNFLGRVWVSCTTNFGGAFSPKRLGDLGKRGNPPPWVRGDSQLNFCPPERSPNKILGCLSTNLWAEAVYIRRASKGGGIFSQGGPLGGIFSRGKFWRREKFGCLQTCGVVRGRALSLQFGRRVSTFRHNGCADETKITGLRTLSDWLDQAGLRVILGAGQDRRDVAIW